MAEMQKAKMADLSKRHPVLQRMKRNADYFKTLAAVAVLAGMMVACEKTSDEHLTEIEKIQKMGQQEVSSQKEKYLQMKQELKAKLEERNRQISEQKAKKDSAFVLNKKNAPLIDSLKKESGKIDVELGQKQKTLDSIDHLSPIQIRMAEKNGTFEKLAQIRTQSGKDIGMFGEKRASLEKEVKGLHDQGDSAVAELSRQEANASTEIIKMTKESESADARLNAIHEREEVLGLEPGIRRLSGILSGIGFIAGLGLIKEGVARRKHGQHYRDGEGFRGAGAFVLCTVAGILLGGMAAATWVGFWAGAGIGAFIGGIAWGAITDN